jgi:hypothetical protein
LSSVKFAFLSLLAGDEEDDGLDVVKGELLGVDFPSSDKSFNF